MTEEDYLLLTDLQRVRNAMGILKDVNMRSDHRMRDVFLLLSDIDDDLYASVRTAMSGTV